MNEGLNISSLSLFERTGAEYRPLNPFGSEFYRDLLGSYGMEVEKSSLEITNFSPFEPLIGSALDKLSEEAKAGVDVLILAHYLPNAIGYNSTTCYLLHKQSWDAFAFAVSDQQTGAVLSAIRFAARYLMSGEYKKAAVIAVDQTALPVACSLVKEREAVDNAGVMVLQPGQGASDLLWIESESRALSGNWGEDFRTELERVRAAHGLESSALAISSDPNWTETISPFLNGAPYFKSPARFLATGALWSLADWAHQPTAGANFLLNVDFSLGRLRSTLYRKQSTLQDGNGVTV